MIYLVSFLDENISYAKREMQNTCYFLNKVCGYDAVIHLHGAMALEQVLNTNTIGDMFVIADYKCHPMWKHTNLHYTHRVAKLINQIPNNAIVMWVGDVRFAGEWIEPKLAIGSYMSTFMPLSHEGTRSFIYKFEQLVLPITWKDLIPSLPFNYSLSETQCYWGDFISHNKEYDLTYIINRSILYRPMDIDYLQRCGGRVMTGNLSKYFPNDKIFVDESKVTEIDYKVYNKDWLELISRGRYTIITDDVGQNFTQMLSARFWEAVRADVIPLIHLSKDPRRKIYDGYDHLQANGYFYTGKDLNKIITFKPSYNECLKELQQFKQQYVGRAL